MIGTIEMSDEDINLWIESKNIEKLRGVVINGGISNKQRRAIWKLLLSIPSSYVPTIAPSFKHNDFKQVQLDVERSFTQISNKEFQKHRREQLLKVIMAVLERNTSLCYYQGFHDIVAVILTFAREPLCLLIMEKLALGPLLPFLNKDFSGLTSMMDFVYPLLQQIDIELLNFFNKLEFDATFAVPYLLTWFTHTATNRETALRCLDLFVASHPLMPIYLVIALVENNRSKFFVRGADEGTATMITSDLMNNIDINQMINNAVEYFKQYPPVKLLELNPMLTISPVLSYMNPNIDYPFPFSDFPIQAVIPTKLYKKRLANKEQDKSRMSAILMILTVLGTFGIRMLDI